MAFTSVSFLIFFIAVLIIYLVLPGRLRAPFLVAAGLFFLASYGVYYLVVFLASTLITYVSGLALEGGRGSAGQGGFVFAAVIIFHVVCFAFFKFNSVGILLPVGYSFYIFQAIAYLVDVHEGEIHVERNLLNFALFQGFFPKLIQGPIESGKNLLPQIHALPEKNVRDPERIRRGALLVLWGLCEKLLIADRIAVPVDAVYSQYGAFGGVEIVLTTFLYAFQIYIDFAGYTDMARGMAEILGFDLAVNFRRPFMADSVQDFWRRWHISLSSWLKKHIYIPLGGSRKGRARKYFNVMVTFIVSGIWHGAGFHYILWGALQGILQTLEDLVHFRNWKLPKALKNVYAYVMFSLTMVVFHANSIWDVLGMLKIVFTNFTLRDFNGMELSIFEWVLVAAGILAVAVKDAANEAGIGFRTLVLKRNAVVRCLIYTAMIAAVVILGVYGSGYDTGGFMYTQF